jgi:hypothetical protein
MRKHDGRLGKGVEPLAKKPLGELVEMFGPQLKLPEDFANPDR